MKRLRIIHRLRIAAALLGFLAVIAGATALWYANHTGLPDSWRGEIERSLARQGIHADVASLRYLPLRGIEAGEVTIYTDGRRHRVLGELKHLVIDVDRSKLSRGKFKVEQLDLSGATVSLAVDPDDPNSKTLELTDAKGRIDFSGPRGIEISRASGMLRGVRLEVAAALKLHRVTNETSTDDQDHAREQRRRILLGIIETFEAFELESDNPPRIRIDARGDLDIRSSLRASIALQANQLKSRELDIQSINMRGDLQGSTLVVHQAEVVTGNGRLGGKLDYNLQKQSGLFELQSNIDFAGLMSGLKLPLPELMPDFSAPPTIRAHGTFQHWGGSWNYHLIGDVALTGPSFKHFRADRFFTRFSTDGERLLLEDILLEEDNKTLTGRAFINKEEILYQAETDLSLPFIQNAIKFEPLATLLADFSAAEDEAHKVVFEGRANPNDPLDWHFKGEAEATGLAFRGVPSRRARAKMDLNAATLDFTEGEVEFDYTDYALKKRHGGPGSGVVTVDRVFYDHRQKTVAIENLTGNIWPAPAVRTFAGEVADQLEVYGFHRPPKLRAKGVVGFLEGTPKQDLEVAFFTPSGVDYEFLGETLELKAPSARVQVLPDRVKISKLETRVFDGDIRADLEVLTSPGSKRVTGELDWTSLQLPAIAEAYQFKSKPTGRITGRIDFSLKGEDISGFDGDGHLALEEAELFDVPTLGPLSVVISKVLGKRAAGFQEATSAFFSFKTRKGILTSTDFLTTTTSMVFTGDGIANLNEQTLNMTIRMNARGLLGVITLPLRPFYGLFQFRGSGPIENPEWKNVMFTSPPKDQESRLLDAPKARTIEAVPTNPPRARVVSPRR